MHHGGKKMERKRKKRRSGLARRLAISEKENTALRAKLKERTAWLHVEMDGRYSAEHKMWSLEDKVRKQKNTVFCIFAAWFVCSVSILLGYLL